MRCRDRRVEAGPPAPAILPRFAMRPFTRSVAAVAWLAMTAVPPIAVHAESATDAPVACTALSGAAPARLIASCTAVIDNPATAEAGRLDATITRAVALHNSGQTE